MNFSGFREFIEITLQSAKPVTQSVLNEPNPDLKYKYNKKKVSKRFKKIPGGSVRNGTFHPTRTLDFDRVEMPQFEDRIDFLKWLMKAGHQVEKVHATPSSLLQANAAHAQNSINVDKAARMIKKKKVTSKLIVLSSDNIIVDGNHHWLALMNVAPDKFVPMFRIDLSFKEIYELAKSYPGVKFSH